VRHFLLLFALLIAAPVRAQDGATATDAPTRQAALGDVVASATELASRTGWETVVYAEHDDQRPGGEPITSLAVLAVDPESGAITIASTGSTERLIDAFVAAAEASAGTLRTILIKIENGQSAVASGPRRGPIEGYNARLRAAAFPAFADEPQLDEILHIGI
jgi:hypothetical protein